MYIPQPFVSMAVLLIGSFLLTTPAIAQSGDADGDTVPDSLDNCLLVANAAQVDADNDGWGNACDPDFNNDGSVNFLDVALFRDAFLGSDPVYDLNSDGAVNFLDLFFVTQRFNSVPGPAGFALWQPFGGFWDDPGSWFPAAVPTSLSHVVSSQNMIFALGLPAVFEVASMRLDGARLEIGPPVFDERLVVLGELVTTEPVVVFEGSLEVRGGMDCADITVISSLLRVEGGIVSDGVISVQSGSLEVSGDVVNSNQISINSGSVKVDGDVIASADIELNSATLEVNGSIELLSNSTIYMSEFGSFCLIKNARISKPLGQIALDFEFPSNSSCTWDNVTLAAKMRIREDTRIVIENDLIMENGDIEIEAGSPAGELVFPGTHSILGSGEIPFVSGSFDDDDPAVTQGSVGSPSLTIGPDILIGVSTSGGSIGSPAGEVILLGRGILNFSNNPLVFLSGTTTLHGSIGTVSNSGGEVRFQGDLITEPESTLFISGNSEILGSTFIHRGSMFLDQADLVLGPVSGGSWTGDGEISSSIFDNSAVTLNFDVATQDIVIFGNGIDQLTVNSSIDNTSQVLSSENFARNVALGDGGRILGGTINANSSNNQSWSVNASEQAFVFDDVSLTGTLLVNSGTTLQIENNLVLGGEIVFADGPDPAVVELAGSQTIDSMSGLLRFENSSGDPARNWLKPSGEQTTITFTGDITLVGSNTSARVGNTGSSIELNGELARFGTNSLTELVADTLTVNDEIRLGTRSSLTVDALDTQFGFSAKVRSSIGSTGSSLLSFVNEPSIQGQADFDIDTGFVPTECSQFTFMTYPSIQFIGAFFPTGDPLPNGLNYALVNGPSSSDVKFVGPSCPQ